MNRRGFAAGVVGIAGSFLFPRKSKASEALGFTDEEMARKIVSHDHNVVLVGSAHYFGCSRYHHYADVTDFKGKRLFEQDGVSEWHSTGDVISCWGSYTTTTLEHVSHEETKSRTVGTRVEVHKFKDGREWYEEWYEISNPDIKAIRFLLDYKEGSIIFGRVDGRWIEL